MQDLKLHLFPELLFVFFASLIAVLSAHVVEAAGFPPCKLCYYQRYFYYALFVVSGVAILFRRKLIFFILIVALLLAEFSVAFFHAGVEMKVFTYESDCAVEALPLAEIDSIESILEDDKIVRCDEPQIVLYGLSMAAWNALFAILILVIFIYLAYAEKRKTHR